MLVSEAGIVKTGLIDLATGGHYDRSHAEYQRRGIRCAKEEALRPYEASNAKIEEQLINIDKHLPWVERFE